MCQQDSGHSKIHDVLSDNKTTLKIIIKESNTPRTEQNWNGEFYVRYSLNKKDMQTFEIKMELSSGLIDIPPLELQMFVKDRLTPEFIENNNQINKWLDESENLELSNSSLYNFSNGVNFLLDLLEVELGANITNEEIIREDLLGQLNKTIQKDNEELIWKEDFVADQIALKEKIMKKVVDNSVADGIPQKDISYIKEVLENSKNKMIVRREASIDLTINEIKFAKSIVTQETAMSGMESSKSTSLIEIMPKGE